jgi:sulfate adenylyltransferase subunit 1 (EFTu-like GTPase family)
MKRFEIERDLLIQTCDTLDHVKTYLIDRLLEMKDKQHSYSLQLSTAEVNRVELQINRSRLSLSLLDDGHRAGIDLQSRSRR